MDEVDACSGEKPGEDSDSHAHIEPDVAEEWREATLADDPVVRKDGSVYLGDQRLGRISYAHGKSSTTMFVHCKMHGCKKCINYSKQPLISGAAKWLAQGALSMTKSEHDSSFLSLVSSP